MANRLIRNFAIHQLAVSQSCCIYACQVIDYLPCARCSKIGNVYLVRSFLESVIFVVCIPVSQFLSLVLIPPHPPISIILTSLGRQPHFKEARMHFLLFFGGGGCEMKMVAVECWSGDLNPARSLGRGWGVAGWKRKSRLITAIPLTSHESINVYPAVPRCRSTLTP